MNASSPTPGEVAQAIAEIIRQVCNYQICEIAKAQIAAEIAQVQASASQVSP